MNPGRLIDDALFDYVFQPVCNRLASVSTPKRIALFCISGLFLADATRTVLNHMTIVMDWVSLVFSVVFYVGTASRPELTGRARNPQRISVACIALRLFSVLMSAFDLIGIVLGRTDLISLTFVWSNLCFLSFLYFEACDRPPPARQRQRVPRGAALLRGGA